MENVKSDFFILDIETKPQDNLVSLCEDEIAPLRTLKDPEKIAADIAAKKLGLKKKMSTDTDLADIICIGIKPIGGKPYLLGVNELEKFFSDNPLAVFITYNGKGFDIPLLIKIGIKNGLDLPYSRLREMCAKWKILGHFDLMEIICNGEYKSLDFLLKVYCGISKTPIDFETATEEEIKTHCLEDLENTEKLYNVFKKSF